MEEHITQKIPKQVLRAVLIKENDELKNRVAELEAEVVRLHNNSKSLEGTNKKLREEIIAITGGKGENRKIQEKLRDQRRSISDLCCRLNKATDEIKRLRSLSVWGFFKEKLRYGK